ncbi:hypothetical protein ACJMK2_036456 [Sinanodonta woodiana]|uniref:MULE transposase domain-containing protein n=1 Tax=Sinanodonta woodiana TaxID=1069815 RepID=A0ABD3WH98_SINWO
MRISENTKLVSDDEKALTKAIEHVFPSARRYLCTKHLKDNIKFYLQNKVGLDKVERNTGKRSLLGSEVIVDANATIEFENRSDKLDQLIKETSDSFKQYYVKNLKPRLRKFVFETNRQSNGGKNTKTNTMDQHQRRVHQQYF